MRDAMSYALHVQQAARGAKAMKALATGGRGGSTRRWAAPLDDLPSVYREIPVYYITNRFTVAAPGVTVNWRGTAR